MSGREDRVVINAVAGLAGALVSGKLTGEEIALESDLLGEHHEVVLRRGPASGLTDAGAVELAALVPGTGLRARHGTPWYDIEWVWDGERFHLVQADRSVRPWYIPSLAGQTALWTNGNTRDVVPHPMRRRMGNQPAHGGCDADAGLATRRLPMLTGLRRQALLLPRAISI